MTICDHCKKAGIRANNYELRVRVRRSQDADQSTALMDQFCFVDLCDECRSQWLDKLRAFTGRQGVRE